MVLVKTLTMKYQRYRPLITINTTIFEMVCGSRTVNTVEDLQIYMALVLRVLESEVCMNQPIVLTTSDHN